jgi:DNA topoisomerase I
VSDGERGFSRRRRGRGFSYHDVAGERIVDPAVRERIEALVIPPAWEDVWICRDARGHLQATGRDEAGRKQYLYHPRWREVRDREVRGLVNFGRSLPTIRRRCGATWPARRGAGAGSRRPWSSCSTSRWSASATARTRATVRSA